MAELNVNVKNVRLSISKISDLSVVRSSELLVQNIPWKVEVCKEGIGEKKSLGIYLQCAKETTADDWSHTAYFIIKLSSFNKNIEPIDYITSPRVFDNYDKSYGTNNLIQWDRLFDIENGFVKNNTINLDIKIKVADSDDPNKSVLTSQIIESNAEEYHKTLFSFNITNIRKLEAVKTPIFNMQKSPWALQVYKNRSSFLCVYLTSKDFKNKTALKVKINCRLISSKGDAKTVDITEEKLFENSNRSLVFRVISWEELLKPINGFVKNKSIIMDLDVKMEKLKRVAEIPASQTQKRRLECTVCLEAIGDQEVSSSKCGHLFCTKCITKSIRTRTRCPACNTVLGLKDFHSLYLSL